ncbi:MAG: hypothetical protein ABGY42_16545 [bacterium]
MRLGDALGGQIESEVIEVGPLYRTAVKHPGKRSAAGAVGQPGKALMFGFS